jgi:hypothetical protein
MEHPNGALSFYPFLRRNKGAFIKCSFLLPGLKAALLESPLTETTPSMEAGKKPGKGGSKDQPVSTFLHLLQDAMVSDFSDTLTCTAL